MSVTAVKNSAQLDISRVPFTAAYAEVAQTVRDAGLMRRRTGSYAILAAGLSLASIGLMVGFIMIGNSWFQLLIALGLGLVLSQFGFFGHEASHRQVMHTGPGICSSMVAFTPSSNYRPIARAIPMGRRLP
jgi:fatty acid desaturase